MIGAQTQKSVYQVLNVYSVQQWNIHKIFWVATDKNLASDTNPTEQIIIMESSWLVPTIKSSRANKLLYQTNQHYSKTNHLMIGPRTHT